MPFVRPLTKLAATPETTAEIPGPRRRGAGHRAAPALRPDVRRLPARPRLHGGRGARGRGPRSPTRSAGPAADCDGDRPRRRAAARRRAPGRDGRDQPLLGPRRGCAAAPGRGARDPGLPQRPGPRLRAGRPRAVLLARALDRPEGRRRGARRRRADGLPSRLRRRAGRGHRDRRDRRRRAGAPAPAPRRRRVLRRAPGHARRASARAPGAGQDTGPWLEELRADESEKRAAERAELRGRPRAAAPAARVRRAARAARPRRRDRVRRRRLRLLRRACHRLVRARLLAGPGPVRLPRDRARVRAGGEARASRPAGRAAARRRRLRIRRAWSTTRSPATASTSSA